ncbi:MAG: NADP-dependent phosphogluconate dehydrogenase [Eubacteriales bacterium]|nr:NADP-dependent phosphogluconate dehydrogenase [Eubacteriales bacterium]
MSKQNIGMIGLGVMGKNLALNIESRGFTVAVYDPWTDRVDEFINGLKGEKIIGAQSIEAFVDSLEVPRRIMMMIKDGKPVDDMIDNLKPFLTKGDILIEGGNSYFPDTIRRNRELEAEGFRYIGSGVSGGEEGARNGPALMPGGQPDAYELIAPIFNAIAAQVEGEPCSTYIGANGAGHYVKMVHNGIEYGDMQLISEAYFLLKEILGLNAEELHEVFTDWNTGELDSYLIEITADIFTKYDPETGKPIVDIIKDAAGQKGTGKWTSQNALDLGVAAPTVAEAVFARCMSALKSERVAASTQIKGPVINFTGDRGEFIEAVRKALYASKICSYAQGFSLMKTASDEYKWDLKLGNIAMIFRGGCIIRAQFLHQIKDAFANDADLKNLMLAPYFKNTLESYQRAWRFVIATAVTNGVAVPAFSSALSYFDSYRTATLPANLLQAQRDYFGAHTYQRVDREGTFHYQWF